MTHVKTPFCLRLKGRAKSVRRCEDDTVTHDTQCTGKGFTPETLGVASAGFTKKKVSRSEGLRTCGGPEHPKHQPADFTFRVLGSITRTESDPPSIASVKSSSIGILRPFLLLLRRSPLPVLGFFDGETLLGRSHVKDTPYSTLHSIGQKSSSSLSNLQATQTCQSNEDKSPFDPSTFRHNRHGCPR